MEDSIKTVYEVDAKQVLTGFMNEALQDKFKVVYDE